MNHIVEYSSSCRGKVTYYFEKYLWLHLGLSKGRKVTQSPDGNEVATFAVHYNTYSIMGHPFWGLAYIWWGDFWHLLGVPANNDQIITPQYYLPFCEREFSHHSNLSIIHFSHILVRPQPTESVSCYRTY